MYQWEGLGATDPYLTSAGGAIAAAAPLAGPAAPFVAIGGLIVSFLGQMGVGSGCGQTCVLSTQYANQAEALLQQNIETYFAQPAPRAQSAQQAALANFATLWQDYQQQASALGSIGQQAISERAAGGCQWKQPASSVPPWGSPAAGACWNWDDGYRAPIADDPNVTDDSTAVAANPSIASTTAAVSSSASSSSGLLLVAAAAVVAVLLLK